MTKNELITQFKKDYPILTMVFNGVETVLESEQYEETIEGWADAQLDKEQQARDLLKSESERAALLERLGLTADEAKLLIG